MNRIETGFLWVMWLALFPVFAFVHANVHKRYTLRLTWRFWLAWLLEQNLLALATRAICRASHKADQECVWLVGVCVIMGVALVIGFVLLQAGDKLAAVGVPAIFVLGICGAAGYFAMFFVIAERLAGFVCGATLALWLIAPVAGLAWLCSIEPMRKERG